MRKGRKTSVEKLVERLRREGWDIPKTYEFSRCYPGHWQRAAGAWVWVIRWQRHREVGSPDSVSKLLKAGEWHHGPYNEIYGG